MLFLVNVGFGDVTEFDTAADGILYEPKSPGLSTGFRRVGDHVEYTLKEMPHGWRNRMIATGNLRIPIERPVFQKDGFCDNALWTEDDRLARTVGRCVTFAKEQAYRISRGG